MAELGPTFLVLSRSSPLVPTGATVCNGTTAASEQSILEDLYPLTLYQSAEPLACAATLSLSNVCSDIGYKSNGMANALYWKGTRLIITNGRIRGQ